MQASGIPRDAAAIRTIRGSQPPDARERESSLCVLPGVRLPALGCDHDDETSDCDCDIDNEDVQGLGADLIGVAREWLDELRPNGKKD